MEQNKTGKYFKYAIGEIVLVVIGILIALQINNSNEARKENTQETTILSDLEEDFRATRLNFIETIRRQEKTILYSRDLIDAIEAKDYSIHPDSIIKFIRRGGFSHHRGEAVMGSYDAIIGSGKTSIIKNKELLKVLANFSSEYKSGFEDQIKSENLLSLMMNASKDFYTILSPSDVRGSLALKKRYTLKEKEIAIKKLYENTTFLAHLIQKTRWETIRAIYQKNLLKSLNRILYQFDSNEITPEKELYPKYIGKYTGYNNLVRKIEIVYADESLYIITMDGRRWKLVQFNSTTFYIIDWNLRLDFSSTDNSTYKLTTQFIDREPVEFTRTTKE